MTTLRAGVGDVWGTGRGPVVRQAPDVRIAAGALVLAACLVAPAGSLAGAALLVASTAGWVLACGTPWRVVWRALGAGVVMLAPLLLLTPWTEPAAGPWSTPASVVLKGLCAMLCSVATVTTLRACDWHEGLSRLPLPRSVAALLAQLVHQAGQLLEETRGMAAAMAIRGASGRWRTGLRLVRALPSVWLPRLLSRAERTAGAMELRGLGWQLPRFRVVRHTAQDRLTVLVCALVLGASLLLRWRGIG